MSISSNPVSDRVASYYDQNTRHFLRFGGSRENAAIHRQIWAPGVNDFAQAFLYLNQLAAEEIAPALPKGSAPGRVLDLGCGVGGTATWMVQNMNVHVTGITNSTVQLRIAIERTNSLGLQRRCRFILGDFLNLPALGLLDAVLGIESFVHAADPRCFFEQIASQVRPGGRLVLCDDFLQETLCLPKESLQVRKWIRRFEKGWQVNSLLPVSRVSELAQEKGFRMVATHNLTPYMRTLHPTLLIPMLWITRLPLDVAYWHNLAGGIALQHCIRQGWTQYQTLVFEKTS